MIISAACFPTPDLIKTTNNPAQWDQFARFAEFQAAAATTALGKLATKLSAARDHDRRVQAFRATYQEQCIWRYKVAGRAVGERPDAGREDYRTEIDDLSPAFDNFTRGTRSEGSHRVPRDLHEPGDQLARVTVPGIPTPASRLTDRLADLAEQRFATEAPDADVLVNKVRLPDGRQVDGNVVLRGMEALDDFGVRPLEDAVVTMTGSNEDRRALREAAFELLARLEVKGAEDRQALAADPAARRDFANAAYFLYQAPKYARGSDATIGAFLVTAHTRIFGTPAQLPKDANAYAYIVGQEAFLAHVEKQLAIVPPQPARSAEANRGVDQDRPVDGGRRRWFGGREGERSP